MKLIDADELITEFACRLDDSVREIPVMNVIRMIQTMPAAENAVKVVWCKDCKHYHEQISHGGYCDVISINGVPEDWFCAAGKGKEGDNEP